MDSVRMSQQSAHQQVERTQSLLTLMTERSQSAHKSREQLTQELTEIAIRLEALIDSIEIDRAEREVVDRDETVRGEEWAAQKGALIALDAAVQEAVRQAEERQSERMRLAQERATREAGLKAAQERLADTRARRERVQQETTTLSESLQEVTVRKAQTTAARTEWTARREEIVGARAGAETDILQIQSAQSATRLAMDSARRLQAEQAARLNTLTELQENHEGFYQGVRAVLTPDPSLGAVRRSSSSIRSTGTRPTRYTASSGPRAKVMPSRSAFFLRRYSQVASTLVSGAGMNCVSWWRVRWRRVNQTDA